MSLHLHLHLHLRLHLRLSIITIIKNDSILLNNGHSQRIRKQSVEIIGNIVVGRELP